MQLSQYIMHNATIRHDAPLGTAVVYAKMIILYSGPVHAYSTAPIGFTAAYMRVFRKILLHPGIIIETSAFCVCLILVGSWTQHVPI